MKTATKIELYTIISWVAVSAAASASSRIIGGGSSDYLLAVLLYFAIKARFERIADNHKKQAEDGNPSN